jgi:cyanate permease
MGLSIGPWLAGYIYDITGTYRFAFFIAMISLFISGIWIWIAAPRKIRTVPGRMRK